MRPNPLIGKSKDLVLDTSVAINLIASGAAEQIVAALNTKVAIPENVITELKRGVGSGRDHFNPVEQMIRDQLLRPEPLTEVQEVDYEALVAGPASVSLDDGEAATIACAVAINGIALLDERKATGIAVARYPSVELATSCDIFSHPGVRASLGDVEVENAVYNALTGARMQVSRDYYRWVVNLIGEERASKCPSLPKRILTAS